MTVTLRRMRWWDLPAVHALEQAVFPVDPWSPAQFWSELAGVPSTRCYLVAERDGEVVGYAGLRVVDRVGDVQTIAVRADAQRGGLGRRLLDALLAEADRRGAREVWLEVRADADAARRLYDRSGFVARGRRRDYYGPGQDGVVMRRG